MQSLRPGAGNATRMYAALPIAAEICLDVVCAYRAHSGAKSPAYGCAPMLDIINPLYVVLPTAF